MTRGISLTTFIISTITKLQVPAYWCSTGGYHTCRTPQCSCRPPWYYIIVLSKINCQWTATDGQICLRSGMKCSAVV